MLSASGHSINTESHNSQSGNEVNASTTQHLCVDSLPTIAITPPPLTDSPSKPTAKALNRGLAALPTAICAYYLNSIKGIGQGCLRVNCKFFHGTEEQLAELRKRHKRLKSPGGSSNASTRSASSNRSGGSKSSKRSRDRERKKKEKEDPPARLKMVKDADLGNKKPIVCLNYLTDTCNRPGCRFLHLPANIRPLPMTVCDYFSAGNCMRKRCRFFHGTQEVLTRMHAKGVTMYNPLTNEAHDPSTSLEELIKLQERTTVPLSAAGPAPVYIIVNQPTGQAIQTQVPNMHQPAPNFQSMGNVYPPFGGAPQQHFNAPLTFVGSQQQQQLPYQPIPHQHQLAPQVMQQLYPQAHIQPQQQTVGYPYSQHQQQHHHVQPSASFATPVSSHLTTAFPAGHTMGSAAPIASQHAYLRPTLPPAAVPHQAQQAIPQPFAMHAMQHQAIAGVPPQVNFQHPTQPHQNLFNPQLGGIYY